jgi:hypothetical protein
MAEATVVHGVCRGNVGRRCSKRTFLFLPGRLCWKCLAYVEARVLAALKEMDADDDA